MVSGKSESSLKAGRVIALVIGTVCLLAGTGAAIYGAWVLSKARASSDWPTTPGVVVNSEVRTTHSSGRDGSSTTYHADVLYEYTVDGENYSADRVWFGQYGSSSRSEAAGTVRDYPAGKQVKVHYSPDDPETAVLEPGATWSSYMVLGIGLVIGLGGAGALAAGVFALKPRKAQPPAAARNPYEAPPRDQQA